LELNLQLPPADAVPAKRLGVPGFWQGKADCFALFTSAYHHISQAALEVALGDDDSNG
jgi:hypothetical protein